MSRLDPARHDFPALPADRALTVQEMRGFRIALGCLVTWGSQIAAHSISLGGPVLSENPMHAQERLGRQIVFMAEALDLTIGRRGI